MEQKKIPPDRPLRTREMGSWKEIAHHLGVNVRTAQKWERERGLPVRRASGVRGRVSAVAASLDAWKEHLASVTATGNHTYRWPLRRGLSVELRFLGAEPQPADIEILCRYLSLFKAAMKQPP